MDPIVIKPRIKVINFIDESGSICDISLINCGYLGLGYEELKIKLTHKGDEIWLSEFGEMDPNFIRRVIGDLFDEKSPLKRILLRSKWVSILENIKLCTSDGKNVYVEVELQKTFNKLKSLIFNK